jgi:adenylate kinase family enzyme
MSNGIIVFGLNGSGKSTIGRQLANELDYKYMDIEDYFFMESDIPYTRERTREECLSLMIADIKIHSNFVLSSVKGNFGDEIVSFYKLGVFIDVPYTTRIKRVEQRSKDKFRDRVEMGGDMYESEKVFLEFVKSRDVKSVEQWSDTLNCPIINIDGTRDIMDNVGLIKETYLRLLD